MANTYKGLKSLVINNPFRILGVYTNASNREIVSSRGRIEAFVKVGKSPIFKTDSIAIGIDEGNQLTYNDKRRAVLIPSRSLENITEASNYISDPRSKLKFAFFWYSNVSKEDECALNCLIEGNKQNAIGIWISCTNFSALLNLGTVAFTEENVFDFVGYISNLIHNDELREEFVSSTCGKEFSISERELAHIFIDTLLNEEPEIDWLSAFRERGVNAEDDEYIENILAQRPIRILETEIEKIISFQFKRY